MATTSMWKIESRLDHVINYANNPEKTLNEDYGKEIAEPLHDVLEYTKNGHKTEKLFYVSGINCTPETAYQDMMITKAEYDKKDGILAFHGYQSFKGYEVSPEVAHEIGIKLAEEMWGDKYEVVVATHLNTKNYHNHFVINSVSFKDGKKYRDCRHNYAILRHLSDSLCEEYGLSVLKEKATRKNINYANYSKGYIQKNPYYQTAKADIDRAIGMAVTYKDFENLLKQMDYEIIYRGKNILSVRRNPYKKNIRVERSFGSEYSIQRIEERIQTTHEERVPFIKSLGVKTYLKDVPKYNSKKHKGLYGLFLYYCYLFGVLTEKKSYIKLSPEMKLEVEKMESISKQAILLSDNYIETSEEFYKYKKRLMNKIDELVLDRQKLWSNYRKSNSEEEKVLIKLKVNEINYLINSEKENLKLCELIEERSPKIEKIIDKIEKEIREEEKQNEHVK